jgi:multiple sugar transport system permease protein
MAGVGGAPGRPVEAALLRRSTLTRTLSYIFLGVSSFIMIWPVLYLVLGAFTTNDRFFLGTLLPLPNTLNLRAMARAWAAVQDAYAVTLLRVGFYLALTLLVGLIGGYLFSKARFPGRGPLFLLLLSGLVMPAVVMMVPMYLLAARFPLAGGNNLFGQGGHGFIGEWPVLFLYGWVPPFAIFLLKQNFDMLPTEYAEAARLDGAGMFTIIFRVYGPLLTPAVAALIVITFLTVWNDYLWPSLTIASNPAWLPIAFRVAGSGTGTAQASPGVFMRLLMAMWPPALVYFALQRYFVQGLVASGLKG